MIQRYPDLHTVAWYDRHDPIHLLTTTPALQDCTTTQIHRLHVLFQHEGHSLLPFEPPPQATNILRALTMQTIQSLEDKNLGA